MAVMTPVQKIAVNIKLNNGTSATGVKKTVSVSLAALSNQANAFDAQKAYNIVNLLSPCLAKTVDDIQKVEISSFENE